MPSELESIPPEPSEDDLAAIARRDPDELGHALAVLSARVDHEFKVAERLSSKSRQLFTIAAVLFAGAQAAAFGTFAQASVSTLERSALLLATLVAVFWIAVVAARATDGEDLQDERAITPVGVFDACRRDERPGMLTATLIWASAAVVQARASSNRDRERRSESAAFATRCSIIATGVEFVIAIAVRI